MSEAKNDEDDENMPTLVPETYFGISPEITGNGSFLNEHTFAHVSGRLLLTEELRNRTQKFWHIPKYSAQHLINAITFDKKREVIVVADEGNPPTLCAYRLRDNERILYFTPEESKCNKFTKMFVHCDSDRLTALLGPPDNLLYTFYLEHGQLEAVTNAMHKGIDTEVTQIFGHLEDTFHYAILGIGIFRFMMWMGDIWEDVFRSFNQAEGIPFTCGTYSSYDTIIAGTADGKIFVISHDGIKGVYEALTVDRILVEVKKKGVKPKAPIPPPIRDVARHGYQRKDAVQFLEYFEHGIIYCVEGAKKTTVHQFLKGRFGPVKPYWIPDPSYKYPSDNDPFSQHGFRKIPIGQIEQFKVMVDRTRPFFRITNLAMTYNGKCIVFTFSGRFLMVIVPNFDISSTKPPTPALMWNVGFNREPIEKVITCMGKNLFVTLTDRALKAYDYVKKEAYHFFTFQDYVYSISLHPTGFFGLASFADTVALFPLQQNYFTKMMEFQVECCKCATFNEEGFLIFIADETRLLVYDMVTFKKRKEINDCQAGKITHIKVSPFHKFFWTARTNGLITRTNMKDGVKKYIFQTTPFKSFATYDNYRLIYVTTFEGTLKEIDTVQDRVTQEAYLRHGQLADVVVSEARRLLIVGTETGHMLVFRIPWNKDAKPIIRTRIHYAPIIKIAISRDENYVLSSAKDGSVCIWRLWDPVVGYHWDGVYIKDDCFPFMDDFKQRNDYTEMGNIQACEADYFERRGCLTTFTREARPLEGLVPGLKRIKDQYFEKKVHPETRFRRLEKKEFDKNLDNLGRDFLLEHEFYYDNFTKAYHERTKDLPDIYKLYDQTAANFQHRFYDRVKQMYDKLQEFRKSISGSFFATSGKEMVDRVQEQLKFSRYYNQKMKACYQKIISQAKTLNLLRTSPKVQDRARRRRRHKHKAKQIMRTAVYRMIVRLLKLYKVSDIVKKMAGEFVEYPFDSDNEESLPFPDETVSEKSRVSATISLVHSDDPLNPMNLNKNLSKRLTPPVSISGPSDEEASRLIWPQFKANKDHNTLLKTRMREKQRKLKQQGKIKRNILNKFEVKHAEGLKKYKFPKSKPFDLSKTQMKNKEPGKEEENDEGYPSHERVEEKISDQESYAGKPFTILREKAFFKRKAATRYANGAAKIKLLNRAFSKLKASRKQQKMLEQFIAKWNPEVKESDMIPLRKPLMQRNYGFILRTDAEGKVLKEKESPDNVLEKAEITKEPEQDEQVHESEERRPTILQLMYSIYIHPETVVKKVSTLEFFKKKFTKSKFRSLLMKYSPASKLNMLATKHLISTQLLRLHKKALENQPLQEQEALSFDKTNKLTARDIMDYDAFSEISGSQKSSFYELSSKDSFFSMSSVKWHNPSEHSISLSSLQACSDLSRTTLPAILAQQKSDILMDESNSSEPLFKQFQQETEKSNNKMTQPDKTVKGLGKTKAASDHSLKGDFTKSKEFYNKEERGSQSSLNTQLEDTNITDIQSTPSSLKDTKKNKSKRWNKLLKAAYSGEDVQMDSFDYNKFIKKAIKGERHVPFLKEPTSEESNVGPKAEQLSDVSSVIPEHFNERDILALQKLHVIKRKGEYEQDITTSEINLATEQLEIPPGNVPSIEKLKNEEGKHVFVETTKDLHPDNSSSTIRSSSICSYDPLELSELLRHEKDESPFVRLGKLPRLQDADARFGGATKDVCKYFDPPVSHDLIATLQQYDLLNKIKTFSSEENLREESDQYTQGSDSSAFDYEKIRWKTSDTDVWKEYFLDEEKRIKSLTKKGLENERLTGEEIKSEMELLEEELVEEGLSEILEEETEELCKSLEEGVLEEHVEGEDLIEEETLSKLTLEGKRLEVEVFREEIEEEEDDEVVTVEEDTIDTLKIRTKPQEEIKSEHDAVLEDEGAVAAGPGPEELEEEEMEAFGNEIEENKLDEYIKFLKKYKGFYINEEIFPCIKYILSMDLGKDAAEEGSDEQTDDEMAKPISDIPPKDVESPKKESLAKGSVHEQANTEDGDLKNDGGCANIFLKENYKMNVQNDEYKPAHQLNEKTSKKRRGKLCKDGVRSAKRQRKPLIDEVWLWWSELLPYNEDNSNRLIKNETISTGILQKDGAGPTDRKTSVYEESSEETLEDESESEEENVVKDQLRQQMLKFASSSKQRTPDAFISKYNMRLWKKIFDIEHPKTVESYEELPAKLNKRKLILLGKAKTKKFDLPTFKRNPKPKDKPFLTYESKVEKEVEPFKEFILKSNSEISFNNVFKKSLPQPKDPDFPSDEVASISSPSFVIHMAEGENKYTLYMRQTVRIKTNLKNKIWFVPEGGKKGEFTKGRFYYPGDVWTKGRTSKTLRYTKLGINDPHGFKDKTQTTPVIKPENIKQKKVKKNQKHGKKRKYLKDRWNDAAQKAHPLHTNEFELLVTKSKGLCLLKENLEKVKYVKIDMPFGPFYILPFRSKRFWNMLSRAIGNKLSIKLRSEVIQQSRAGNKATDIHRRKPLEKPFLETEAKIGSSGKVLLKVTSVQKLPLNEKQFSKLLNKDKPRKTGDLNNVIRHSKSLKAPEELVKRETSLKTKRSDTGKKTLTDKTGKEAQLKFMNDLVAEFFPERKVYTGSFYIKLKMKKWLSLFKESTKKPKPKCFEKKLSIYTIQKVRPKAKIPELFRQKYLKDLEFKKYSLKGKHVANTKLKKWLSRHVGTYKGPKQEKSMFYNQSFFKQKSISPNNLEMKEPQDSEVVESRSVIERKDGEPCDELREKVNKWLEEHYKYLKKKVKMEKDFTLYEPTLEFGRYVATVRKRNVPHLFIHRTRHFERALNRWLKSLNNKLLGKKRTAEGSKKERLSLRKATDIIKHYTEKETAPCKELWKIKDKTRPKVNSKCLKPDEVEQQLFSTKRWKQAMLEENSKEGDKQDKRNEENQNQKEVILCQTDLREVRTGLSSADIVPIKPCLKMDWPDSVLKVRKKLVKKIVSGNKKRKYEEPIEKYISTQGELMESHRGRYVYNRQLQTVGAVSACGQKLNYLPAGERAKITALPHHFKLESLDTNYYNLKKLQQHFLDHTINVLRTHCINASKMRRATSKQLSDRRLYEAKKEMFKEKVKEADKYNREYNLHKRYLALMAERVRRSKCKMRKELKIAHDHLKSFDNLAEDLDRVIDIYFDKAKTKDFKNAVKEMIEKYVPETKEMAKQMKTNLFYNSQVLRNIQKEVDAHQTLKKLHQDPKVMRIGEANRYVKFAYNQNTEQEIPKEDENDNRGEAQDSWGPYETMWLGWNNVKIQKLLKKYGEGKNATDIMNAYVRDVTEKAMRESEEVRKLEKKLEIARQKLQLDAHLKTLIDY